MRRALAILLLTVLAAPAATVTHTLRRSDGGLYSGPALFTPYPAGAVALDSGQVGFRQPISLTVTNGALAQAFLPGWWLLQPTPSFPALRFAVPDSTNAYDLLELATNVLTFSTNITGGTVPVASDTVQGKLRVTSAQASPVAVLTNDLPALLSGLGVGSNKVDITSGVSTQQVLVSPSMTNATGHAITLTAAAATFEEATFLSLPRGTNMAGVLGSLAELATAPTNVGTIFVPGLGGYRWDATNTLSTNMLRIAKSGVATGRFVYADRPVRLSVFGVAGDGLTDDTAALQIALDTLAGQEVFADAGTYILSAITVPQDTTLRLDTRATLKWATVATNASVTMVTLNAGSSLLGGTLDGNRDVTAPLRDTSKRYYLAKVAGDGVTIDGVKFRGGLNYEIFAARVANTRVLNCISEDSAQGPGFFHCTSPILQNWKSLNFRGTLPNIYQHVLDIFYCDSPMVSGVLIEGYYAASPAPSTVLSGITMAGNKRGSYSDIVVRDQAPGGQNALALLWDGDIGSVANNITIIHAGTSSGVEFQGVRNCTFNNFVIDGTEDSTGRRASTGAHIYNCAITGLPGVLYSAATETQARGGSEAGGNVFSNWRIIGTKTGLKNAASRNQFSNIKFIGCGDTADNTAAALRFLRFDARYITSWSGYPLPSYIEGNTFTDVEFVNCATQLLITGHGDRNSFRGVRFINGNQGDNPSRGRAAIAFWPRISKTGSTFVAATTNTVEYSDLNLIFLKDYQEMYFHIHSGTGAGQSIPIQEITGGGDVVVLKTNFATLPDATSSVSISELKTGTITFDDVEVRDDGAWSVTASMNLTNTAFTSASRFTLALLDGPTHRVTPGLRLTLQNALGSGTNLTVEVTAADPDSSDIVQARPISPTSGTLDTNQWLTAGTGTLSGNASGSVNDLIRITGTGTDFSSELPGQAWIRGADGQWVQFTKWNSATEGQFVPPTSPAWTNVSWQISRITAAASAQQRYALDMVRYPVNANGHVEISRLSHQGLTTGVLIQTESDPSVLAPTLAVNDATPDIGQFPLWYTANTSATTLTDLDGGMVGMHRRLVVADSNTSIAYSGDFVGGNATRALASGEVLDFIQRADGKWVVTAGNAYVQKVGDTMTGQLVITNASTSASLRLQRANGIESWISYDSGNRPKLNMYNGWVLVEESDGDHVARFAVSHETDGEEPTGIYMASSGGQNSIVIGGGTSLLNAATRVGFRVATNNTTLMGTEVARFGPNGLRLQPSGVAGDPLSPYALDVQTTTQAVRVIPPMTSAQRLALSSMGNGAMVHDTDAQRPFYYDTTTGPNWRGVGPFGPTKVVTTGGGTLTGTIDDMIVEVSGTGGDQTYTPYEGGRGWMTRILRAGASTNALIIDPTGTNTVNGAATVSTTNQFGGFDLYHNGTEWRAIELNPPAKETPWESAMRIVGGTTKYQPVIGGFFLGTASHTLVDGQARYVAIVVEKPTTLTGVQFFLRTTGSYTADNTNSVALFSYSGGTLTLVAQSANNAALYAGTANTYISEPFSAPYAAAAGLYYAALIYNQSAEVTAPVVQSVSVGNSAIVAPAGSTSKLNGFSAGLTGFPASTTASGIGGSSAMPVLAVY